MNEEISPNEKTLEPEIQAEAPIKETTPDKNGKKEKKNDKVRPINWKNKFVRIMGLLDRFIEKRIGKKMDNESKQIIASEWDDVLQDLDVKPPMIVRIAIAVAVTIAVVLDSYGNLFAKLSRKKEDGDTKQSKETRSADKEA
jgi:hypothetical protein